MNVSQLNSPDAVMVTWTDSENITPQFEILCIDLEFMRPGYMDGCKLHDFTFTSYETEEQYENEFINFRDMLDSYYPFDNTPGWKYFMLPLVD